jgi:4-diphosphocytidyl-2-C-methyl-D-erythritol kinase
MICFPNAKINLGLLVTGRRPDGFHNIETVFYPIPLCDVLEVLPAGDGRPSLSIYGNSVPGGEENLCMKAYRLLEKRYGLTPVAIHLLKRIPDGAGLGGGSSDAAHIISMLNSIFNLGLDTGMMEDLASELGSDCAFFIRNKAVFAGGRGNRFSPVEVNLSAKYLMLVKPAFGVSTGDAYAMLRPLAGRPSPATIVKKYPREWEGSLVNDFEAPVFEKYPELANIRRALYERGAIYAAMSGSGSAVYGIFDGHPPPGIFGKDHFTWTCRLS